MLVSIFEDEVKKMQGLALEYAEPGCLFFSFLGNMYTRAGMKGVRGNFSGEMLAGEEGGERVTHASFQIPPSSCMKQRNTHPLCRVTTNRQTAGREYGHNKSRIYMLGNILEEIYATNRANANRASLKNFQG